MIFLRTGLPGGGKTLNSLKEIVEDSTYSNRPKYYTNIRLLMLDIDVCNTFSGWFYGIFLEELEENKRARYNKIIKLAHDEDRFVTVDDVPWLAANYSSFTYRDATGLFLKWVKKLYPKSELEKLDTLFEMSPDPTIEQIKSLNYHFTYFEDATKWNELPAGALIFIDECQHFFPVKPHGSKRPEHYEKFQTHRHKGYDIHLVTQDPLFIDSHVRNLAGWHIHYKRPLGGSVLNRWRSDSIISNIRDTKELAKAVKSTFPRDSKYYGLYWSSDEHTHKAKIPWQAYMLPFLLAIVGYFIYWLVDGGLTGEVAPDSIKKDVDKNTPVHQKKVVKKANKPRVVVIGQEQFDHPLKNICISYEYTGYEVTKIDGAYVVEHFINCTTQDDKTYTDTNEDGSLQKETVKKVRMFSSYYLEDMGYRVALNNRSPVLLYDNNKILMHQF